LSTWSPVCRPGANAKPAERSERRVKAWRPLAQQLAEMDRRTFCLVMAPDRYRDPNDPDRRHRDDPINKTAARQALTTV
jgi:hypothetical protein